MKKLFCLFLVIIFVIPFTYAEIYQVNTTMTFYSDLYNGSLQYLPSNQSVTTYIYNLNNSPISSGNMILQFISATNNTKWAFNTTTNSDGDYYRLTNYFSGSVLIAQSSETFRVVTNINDIAQDTSESMSVPLLIGLSVMLLIFFFSYVGYRIQNVPSTSPNDLWKEPRFYLGFQFYLFAILFIIVLFFLLMQMAINLPYYSVIKTLFIVIMSVFGSVMLLCAFMTVPLLISSLFKILNTKKS